MSDQAIIKAIEAEIKQHYARIDAVRKACDHDWQPSNPEWLSASSPRCMKCGDVRNGWWCESSPTKECDYSRPNGRGFNPDSCRYCGDPEERK